jgi:hypothetical protein
MRIWIHKHPILLSLAASALTLAAAFATVFHYLGSWMILPLF